MFRAGNKAINRTNLELKNFNGINKKKFHKESLWRYAPSLSIIRRRVEGVPQKMRDCKLRGSSTNYKFPESVIRRSEAKLYH